MKRISVLLVISFFTICSCSESSIKQNLMGEWEVERIEVSTGEVLEDLDMRFIFTRSKYSVHANGKQSFNLDYEIQKDETSYFIVTTWQGEQHGERFYILEPGRIRFELYDYFNGHRLDMKYYLKKIQED